MQSHPKVFDSLGSRAFFCIFSLRKSLCFSSQSRVLEMQWSLRPEISFLALRSVVFLSHPPCFSSFSSRAAHLRLAMWKSASVVVLIKVFLRLMSAVCCLGLLEGDDLFSFTVYEGANSFWSALLFDLLVPPSVFPAAVQTAMFWCFNWRTFSQQHIFLIFRL